MFRWLVAHHRTILLAFALAITVWISAVNAADPDQTRAYPSAIPLTFIGQDPSVVISSELPQQVQISLRAPQSVWDKLDSGEVDIRAVVDLSGIETGEHKVNIQVQVGVRPVRVISTSPASITIILEPLITRSLPVEVSLTGEPAIGYQVGDPILEITEAVVSGPVSRVDQVAYVYAVMDLTDQHQNIAATVPLSAVNEEHLPLAGLSIYPEAVLVRLPVSQLTGYRDLAVKVATFGQPANGYRLTNVTSFPPSVTVFSQDPTLIGNLPGYVTTMPLDLSGESADIDTHLALDLPVGVTLVGNQTVEVRIGIAPVESSLKMAYRPVEVTGLETGMQAQVAPATVDVMLSGPLPVLDMLSSSDIQVRVDATGLIEGTYQLTPTVTTVIKGIKIESVLPGKVEVIISSTAEPTP